MTSNQNERPIPGCKVMSKDCFWMLIEEVKKACGQDQEKYMAMLKARLKELGPEYAQDFHDIVHAYEDLANKYGLWSASELMGRATDDGFIDFRAWLISQGKEAYFSALKNPDTMADLDPGDGYWFESFTYTGDSALEELTGKSAYDHTDRAAYEKMVEALKADIDYDEGILFEDSIRNNIKMWDDSIEDFEMILAARDAQLHEDIMQRDSGYDYKLTEGGKDFSGGQRQRMEIARVLAQDPTIIILDEATSALDAKTEYEVVKSIKDRGITCIVVAHRLSTIRDCDEIIVMDRGKVVERGTHQELFAKNGLYAQLVSNE